MARTDFELIEKKSKSFAMDTIEGLQSFLSCLDAK
jgi:hypothetical protein